MGTMWGIGASVARVHALLLASNRAFTLDEIAETLQLAKSTVSTALKELRTWGVVRRHAVPGERKERFSSEGDPWTMLFNIARERKRREFDPMLRAVREALQNVGEGTDDVALERLRRLEEMLSAMDSVASRALSNERAARALLEFLSTSR